LTGPAATGQNASVHRLILALGLCALLYATGRTGPVPSEDVVTIAAEACAVTSDSPDRDSGQQWRKAHHAIAVVTESVWKSSPVHAGLGSTRVARLFELARFVSAPDPPAASTPHYLLHTPLLI
jgi:hypothetical protein